MTCSIAARCIAGLQKLGPAVGGGGCYYQGQLPFAAAQGQGGLVAAAATNGMVPMYPLYHLHHHPSLGMGLSGHFFTPTNSRSATNAMATIPTTANSIPATGTLGFFLSVSNNYLARRGM